MWSSLFGMCSCGKSDVIETKRPETEAPEPPSPPNVIIVRTPRGHVHGLTAGADDISTTSLDSPSSVGSSMRDALKDLAETVGNLNTAAAAAEIECRRPRLSPLDMSKIESFSSQASVYRPLDSIAHLHSTPCVATIVVNKTQSAASTNKRTYLRMRCGEKRCRGRRVRVASDATETIWNESFDFEFSNRRMCDTARIEVALCFDDDDDDDDDGLIGAVSVDRLDRGQRIRDLELRNDANLVTGIVSLRVHTPCTLLVEIAGARNVPSRSSLYAEVIGKSTSARTRIAYATPDGRVEWNETFALHFRDWTECLESPIAVVLKRRRRIQRDLVIARRSIEGRKDGLYDVDIAREGETAIRLSLRMKALTGIVSPWKAI